MTRSALDEPMARTPRLAARRKPLRSPPCLGGTDADPGDFPASSDAIPSCKLIDYRAQFAVCREEPPEPRTLEMPRPATRAGLKHPAEGRGN